jgi:hypothetical protein
VEGKNYDAQSQRAGSDYGSRSRYCVRHHRWRLIGGGIGRAAGDTRTGVLIGSGIGMMIDFMD